MISIVMILLLMLEMLLLLLLLLMMMTMQHILVVDGVGWTSMIVERIREMMLMIQLRLGPEVATTTTAATTAAGVVVRGRGSRFGRHRIHPQDGGGCRRAGSRTAVAAVQISRWRSSVRHAIQRRTVKRFSRRRCTPSCCKSKRRMLLLLLLIVMREMKLGEGFFIFFRSRRGGGCC